ncbi:MAG: ATP phosphoribosyltransferase regulatory subunit, partial [Clostridia bacterium]|nr:ATP phosphoribosyltransferase regulatory subunit [Clostridia bacterium]
HLALPETACRCLRGLINVCGNLSDVLESVKELICGEESQKSYDELNMLSQIIDSFGLSDKFMIDFSVINDMNYYNGLVFQGYVSGVPKSVLSGGRYDNLVKRFGLDTAAAGFAVSIDLLKNFCSVTDEYDCDVLLVYSEDANPVDVINAEEKIISGGESCIALSEESKILKYKRKVVLE